MELEKEETVEEEIEEKTEGETPEQELERLKAENAELVVLREKHNKLLHDQSLLGRGYRELQDGQAVTNETIAKLQARIDVLDKPKSDDDSYIDITNPVVADKWFRDSATKMMTEQDREQKAYTREYEKYVRILLEESEEMSSDEKAAVMANLENQKENMFNDPLRDAQWNIEKSKLQYYKGIVHGGSAKKVNLRQDKVAGTGVGGSGTSVSTSKKKEQDTPELAKLRSVMDSVNKNRGW